LRYAPRTLDALAAYRDLLGNRPLAKLLAGEFVSAIGDWLYIVALLVVIYGQTGDPLVLGLFGAARIVPYILLSVPAGMLADRVDRRLILLVTDLARGVCMIGMALVVAIEGPIWILVALSVLAACFSTFFYPSIGAYIPNLARDERQLGPANSAWASLDNLGFVVGPVLGGLLLASGGTTLAFLINGATFVVIAAVLWTLPPSSGVRAPVLAAADAAAGAGVRSAGQERAGVASSATPLPSPESAPPVASPAGRRVARPAGSAVRLAGIAVLRFVDYAIYGGIGVLTVIFATDVLAAGDAATGYLNAAIGVGGVAGAVISGLLVLRRSLTVPIVAGAAIIAAGATLLGLAQTVVVAMAAIALACAGHLILEVIAATLLQRVTTDAVRGRAVGTMVSVSTLAEATGALVFPILVVSAGPAVPLGLAGGGMLVAALGGLLLIGGATDRAASPFEATVARVSRLPLFAGVPNAALEGILGSVRLIAVAEGQSVVRQGDPADRFFIIETGTFVVRQAGPDGTERELRRLSPDDVFGELGLLTGSPRSATVAAATDGTLLVLDGADFLALVAGTTAMRGHLLGLYEGLPAPPAPA